MKHVQTENRKLFGHMVNIPMYFTCIYTTKRRTSTLHTLSFQFHQNHTFFSSYQHFQYINELMEIGKWRIENTQNNS